MSVEALVERVLHGDVRAAARACRGIDDRLPGHTELLARLFQRTQRAWLLGITGNPGAGKSTLTDRLLTVLRTQGQRVAVLAVDPSSPFSGGAVLGDRLRMQRHFEDPEVFIRSVAARGKLGGLARSTLGLIQVMQAWGAQTIIMETVGVGQAEIDVMRAADTTAIVMAPGLGDEVQAAKAGLLECGDVFVVNKADRQGAEALVSQLEQMIALGAVVRSGAAARAPGHGHGHGAATAAGSRGEPSSGGAEPEGWSPPVLSCVATRGDGIVEIFEALKQHRTWLESTPLGRVQRDQRRREQVLRYLKDSLVEQVLEREQASIEAAATAVMAGEVSPFEAGDALVEQLRPAVDGQGR